MFKLRDGPIDWYFCDSEHALNWLESRHRTVKANRILRMLPRERERELKGVLIEDFLSKTSMDSGVRPPGRQTKWWRSKRFQDLQVGQL